MAESIKKAHQQARTASSYIRNCTVQIMGLPAVPIAQKTELVSHLEELIDELSIVVVEGSIWLPTEGDMTATSAMVEIGSEDKVDALLQALQGHKLKFKADPPKPLKLARWTAEDDATQTLYLKHKLIQDGQLTPAFSAALTEVFCRYATHNSSTGILTHSALNKLQLTAVGEEFSDADFTYYLQSFENREEEGQKGITLAGFHTCYVSYADTEPLAVWKELEALGYDVRLHRAHSPPKTKR